MSKTKPPKMGNRPKVFTPKDPNKPRKKFVKPTADEKEARIDHIVELLATRPGMTRYKLHKMLTKKYNVRWESIDRYLSRAKELLLERLKRSKEEFKSNAIAFYETTISNPKICIKVRLKAQKQLDDITGVKAPIKTELTGNNGEPLETKLFLNSLTVDQLRQTIGKMEQVEHDGTLTMARRETMTGGDAG